MYKELIQTCRQNVQSLKSQIGMCEAQITFGTKRIKDKYKKQQEYLYKKLKEEMYWLIQYTLIDYVKEYLGGNIKEGEHSYQASEEYLRSQNVKII